MFLLIDIWCDKLSNSIYILNYYPVGKIAEKAMRRSVFLAIHIALYIECRFNKNSLLQCYFLVILPAGYETILSLIRFFEYKKINIKNWCRFCVFTKKSLCNSIFFTLPPKNSNTFPTSAPSLIRKKFHQLRKPTERVNCSNNRY